MSALQIVQAFNKIILHCRIMWRLYIDTTKDFTSKNSGICKKRRIPTLLQVVKSKLIMMKGIYRQLNKNIQRHDRINTPRYIDVLLQLVDSHNKTSHTAIQSEPINVTKNKEKRLWLQMYWPKEKSGKYEMKRKKSAYAFKEGDRVCIYQTHIAFKREYDTKCQQEIFKIHRWFLRQDKPIYHMSYW